MATTGRPQERIARLQELAAQLRDDEPGDFGDGDPQALLGEIDEAIARLPGDIDRDPDLVVDDRSPPTTIRSTIARRCRPIPTSSKRSRKTTRSSLDRRRRAAARRRCSTRKNGTTATASTSTAGVAS